eukprot:scaffold30502_cov63-Phaeocystis_antarctica.AAC.4
MNAHDRATSWDPYLELYKTKHHTPSVTSISVVSSPVIPSSVSLSSRCSCRVSSAKVGAAGGASAAAGLAAGAAGAARGA